MIEARCDCGAVRIELAEAPKAVFDCQCDGCQRMGVLWAYYHPSQVQVVSDPDATVKYQRATRTQDFHFCQVCGNVTHWASHDPNNDNMGINSRLMPADVRAAAQVLPLAAPS